MGILSSNSFIIGTLKKSFVFCYNRYSQMTLRSKKISNFARLNPIDMTAAMVGERFDLEDMKDSATTDSIIDSLFEIEKEIL